MQFFDPGERYCPYGHLAWQHEFLSPAFARRATKPPSRTSRVTATSPTQSDRVANLKMDATGLITGKIDMTYSGPAALRWRHAALRGDDESLKHELRSSLEERHSPHARDQRRHRRQRRRLRESSQGQLQRRRHRRQLDRQTPRRSRGSLHRQPQGHLPAREARDRRGLQLPAMGSRRRSASTFPRTSPSRPLRPLQGTASKSWPLME